MLTLYMRDEQGPLGSVTVDGDRVVKSDNPELADLVKLAKNGGKHAADLNGWFNGYVMVSTDPNAPWPTEEAV